ncbi:MULTISPECIES: PCC domain-containing protein [Blautia]|jgi:predicted DNA-binding protein with PD1-like motif|uniref:PPC domain-containing DNA-binding protein n=1 Tax=Blautia TaxID=572511 RepID=UPI0015BADF9B
MYESACGKNENIYALRLPPGTDVLEAIIDFCEEHQISDGVIMSALGSWKRAVFCNPTDLPNGKVGYGEPTILEGYYELINLSGMICHDEDGKILPHIHLTISDMQGNSYGGHMQIGCEVLITTDIVIGSFSGLVMGRRYDEAMGVPLFAPSRILIENVNELV